MRRLKIFIFDGNREFDPEYSSTVMVVAASNKKRARELVVTEREGRRDWEHIPCKEIGVASASVHEGVIIRDKSY